MRLLLLPGVSLLSLTLACAIAEPCSTDADCPAEARCRAGTCLLQTIAEEDDRMLVALHAAEVATPLVPAAPAAPDGEKPDLEPPEEPEDPPPPSDDVEEEAWTSLRAMTGPLRALVISRVELEVR